jgi:hypothetical protein
LYVYGTRRALAADPDADPATAAASDAEADAMIG